MQVVRAAVAVALSVAGLSGPAAADIRGVVDLDGRPVDVLAFEAGTRAQVLIFTTTDCPISNRYAPEISRLASRFGGQGVRFHLVYPVPVDTADKVRGHLAAFALTAPAVRDTAAALVRETGVTVTPEVAVIVRGGRQVYRGRIDDRYVDLGIDRQIPTTRDLERVLDAVVAGAAMTPTTTKAVGCYLPDLVK